MKINRIEKVLAIQPIKKYSREEQKTKDYILSVDFEKINKLLNKGEKNENN